MNPIFVLGTGRCGTVTLAKLFSTVPGVVSFHEGAHVTSYGKKQCFSILHGFNHLLVAEGNRERAFRGTQPRIAFIQKIREVFVESNSFIWPYIPYLRETFPSLKIIHLIRNPVDCIRSFSIRDSMYGSRHTTYSMARKVYPDSWSRLRKICQFWVDTNNRISDLGPDVTLWLEDLDVTSFSKLLKTCGLPVEFDELQLRKCNMSDSGALAKAPSVIEAVSKWIR